MSNGSWLDGSFGHLVNRKNKPFSDVKIGSEVVGWVTNTPYSLPISDGGARCFVAVGSDVLFLNRSWLYSRCALAEIDVPEPVSSFLRYRTDSIVNLPAGSVDVDETGKKLVPNTRTLKNLLAAITNLAVGYQIDVQSKFNSADKFDAAQTYYILKDFDYPYLETLRWRALDATLFI